MTQLSAEEYDAVDKAFQLTMDTLELMVDLGVPKKYCLKFIKMQFGFGADESEILYRDFLKSLKEGGGMQLFVGDKKVRH